MTSRISLFFVTNKNKKFTSTKPQKEGIEHIIPLKNIPLNQYFSETIGNFLPKLRTQSVRIKRELRAEYNQFTQNFIITQTFHINIVRTF